MTERLYEFRSAVMDELDRVYDECGTTPDHILLSPEIYYLLKTSNGFERIGDDTIPKRRAHAQSYLGLRVWLLVDALDSRDKDALLLSEEAFVQLCGRAKDL